MCLRLAQNQGILDFAMRPFAHIFCLDPARQLALLFKTLMMFSRRWVCFENWHLNYSAWCRPCSWLGGCRRPYVFGHFSPAQPTYANYNDVFGGWCSSMDDAHCIKRGVGGGVMTFIVDCKLTWCLRWMMFFGGWCTLYQRGGRVGWGGGGGGVMTFIVDCKLTWCLPCLGHCPWKQTSHGESWTSSKFSFAQQSWRSQGPSMLFLWRKQSVERWMQEKRLAV